MVVGLTCSLRQRFCFGAAFDGAESARWKVSAMLESLVSRGLAVAPTRRHVLHGDGRASTWVNEASANGLNIRKVVRSTACVLRKRWFLLHHGYRRYLASARKTNARLNADISQRNSAAQTLAASVARTTSSGAPVIFVLPKRFEQDEFDLACFGFLVDLHQVDIPIRAQRRRLDRQLRRGDHVASAAYVTPRRAGRAGRTDPPPSPCRSQPPRHAAIRRSRGRPRSHGRTCGRN